VSLAELFQNALKHNTIAPHLPLHIRVAVEGPVLVFDNDLRCGSGPTRSTGVGLRNLSERFRLATGRAVEWGVEAHRFVVRLPLVEGGSSSPRRAGCSER
jgi:hypothetical protein